VVLILMATPGAAAAQPVTVVQTTANLHDALTVQAPQAFTATRVPGSAVIRVDSSMRYQRIAGFGGAMTDSSAWLLDDELTPEWRAVTLNALFGPSGLNLNFVRIPMAASDYTVSPAPYSYDDEPPGQTDPTLADFSIAHDGAYIIPALRQVLRINPGVFTLANPWTAPPWMKANHTYDDNGLAGSVLPQDYSALAQYFVKFIQGYQAAGVPIDAGRRSARPTTPHSCRGTSGRRSPRRDCTRRSSAWTTPS